jgi:Zn-dependent M16 (insulinase) family peptidase
MELSLKHEPQNFGIKLLMFLAPVWGHVRDPIDNLIMFSNFRQTFEEQYEKNPNLLKELIRKHFVENHHRLVAVMTPRTDPAVSNKKRDQFCQVKSRFNPYSIFFSVKCPNL